jgi:hypothetical protein
MNLPQEKPQYLEITDKWAFKVVLLWCVASLIIGVTFVEVTIGIAAPIMTLIMLFAGKYMVKLLLSIQKTNPVLTPKIYNFAIMFFWGAGIYGCLTFIFKGSFGEMDAANSTYFIITASMFPLGSSIGASEMWRSKESYE